MLINLTNLSSSDLLKIPLSIRLNLKSNILDTNILPIEIAYELRNINNNIDAVTYVEKSTVDLIPKLSVYTDLLSISSKNDAIIEYVKNFLLIDRGDYPFDPTFGTTIKKYLQTLDTNSIKLLIDNELRNLTIALSTAFDVDIRVLTSKLVPINNSVSVEYKLVIELEVEDIISKLTFSKSVDSYYLM